MRREISSQELLVDLGQNDEFFMNLSEIEFRTVVHGKVHHSLEIQINHCLYTGAKMFPRRPVCCEHLLELWDRRGLSHDLPEYIFAKKMIDMAYDYQDGKVTDLSEYATVRLTEEEQKRFEEIVAGLRPAEAFTDEEVSDEAIDSIIDSGLWAPNGGNLQPLRFLVIHEKNDPGLFRSSTSTNPQVHIVIANDSEGMRGLRKKGGWKEEPGEEPFLRHRNTPLNCGAALQNMMLTARVWGLGSSMQTFAPGEAEAICRHYSLAPTVTLMTYIDIGHEALPALPQSKVPQEKTVLYRF